MEKIILHSDLNNFFASVECVDRPDLIGKAVAVSGNPEMRHGIILAKNQIAKIAGVKTGDTIGEAKRKCPGIIFLPPHYDKYEKFSKEVKEIYYNYTDKIEAFGLDECWLDVTGSTKLFGSGVEIANKIREHVKSQTGLTVSIGVSFSKNFAKLGSDIKKPDAVTVIDKSNYKTIAWDLPVTDLIYVGKSSTKTLAKLNIKTIGDLAQANDKLLEVNLGINGLKIKQSANGLDDSTVKVYSDRDVPKSVGHGTTTFKDMTDNATVKTVIFSLCDLIAIRLRKYGVRCGGVSISIRSNELTSFLRQKLLLQSTQNAKTIGELAYEIFTDCYDIENNLPIRSISVSTFNISKFQETNQISLFDNNFHENNEKTNKLETALFDLRKKYGYKIAQRASYLQNDYALDSFQDNDEGLPFYRG